MKILKIAGIAIASIIILLVILAKIMDVTPTAMGMHDTIQVTDGLAIGGYDAVNYFTASTAAIGTTDFSYEWNDATWQFASQSNLDQFKSTPKKYAPQYGGYCGFAMSKGFAASVDPNSWHVENDKLYLFNSLEVKETFLADLDKGIIAACDKNWN